ncbi:hypothetical protein GYMLUDRAFT_76307 [Collybiopsis luxurians FD-317 M1]|uniref:RING-type domain-containing protein n=1 Tax=Collybiopsis luxurians FD-317 M1 TaxID=944289 RepID=A0A0D0CDR1_9AGAR|nr:hypothetical protein GYMLUDRAFT_76307 [Collybiopsis luxurians FD-317 M1]
MNSFPLPVPLTSSTPTPRFRAPSAMQSSYSSLNGWDDQSRITYRSPNSAANWWLNDNPHLYAGADDDDTNDVANQLVDTTDLSQHQSSSSLSRILNNPDEQPTFSNKGKGKAKEEDEEDELLLTSKSKSKGKQKALPPNAPASQVSPEILAEHSLSTYTCPICFCPPTNATITPCGHLACGSCLFTAIKTAQRRENRFGGGAKEDGGPRCPVCRAIIPGWDGKGGGVIGLVMQTVTVAT